MDNLDRWLVSTEEGHRDGLKIVVPQESYYFAMFHEMHKEHQTPEIPDETQVQFLTEGSAPTPTGGMIFLMLVRVGVDPAGLRVSKTSLARD